MSRFHSTLGEWLALLLALVLRGLCGKQKCQCTKHRICPRGIVHNVGVCGGRGIGGLGNEAKRNAKTDQLRPVPRHNVNKEKRKL